MNAGNSTEELIRKYDINVPRYTSYPTANHFHEIDGNTAVRAALCSVPDDEPLSLYLHIPFCSAMCAYCGCHTVILKDYEAAQKYVQALCREIETVSNLIGKKRRRVEFIHWGGGTPTFLKDVEIEKIAEALRASFTIGDTADHAMEIDPRTLAADPGRAKFLSGVGVNRVSLGVQDLNPEVQRAIGRIQPFEVVESAVKRLREAGIRAINFDMIYGLPLQTPESIAESMKKALELKPDRLAVFGYAHVPWMKKNQEALEKFDLPGAVERYLMYENIIDVATRTRYVEIGIDHFCLPDDPLAGAVKDRKLRRNFQGYTTDSCLTLIGFGASAISRLPEMYAQNTPMIGKYMEKISTGVSVAARGMEITPEDLKRGEIIESLMCYREADFGALEDREKKESLERLREMESSGLLSISGTVIKIDDKGKPFTRVVCTAFDPLWKQASSKHARAV